MREPQTFLLIKESPESQQIIYTINAKKEG